MPRTIACGVDQSDAAEAVANTARWSAIHRPLSQTRGSP